MDDLTLINLAIEAQQKSYSPYSNVKVGVALVTKNDRVFLGCNIENSSHGAAVCGERTAIFKAISEGEKEFKTLVVTSSLDDFVYPCGICRQVMNEFFSKDTRIIITNKNKEMRVYTIRDLLPKGFSL